MKGTINYFCENTILKSDFNPLLRRGSPRLTFELTQYQN